MVVVLKKGDLTQEEADAIVADSAGTVLYRTRSIGTVSRMISVSRGGVCTGMLVYNPVLRIRCFLDPGLVRDPG